ncbi:MAG: extracellular solute-binding protein [Clostridiales bacterium]|nr:extracellular solute-binding protein [Clostridiales bacterium]
MKKILAIGLAAMMLFAMAACRKNEETAPETGKAPEVSAGKEKVSLKVWGSREDQKMLGEMIEAFKAAHPGKEYAIELGVVGEPDAKTRYLEDPAAAADVFTFSNDQIRDLVGAGALYEVTRNKDTIVAANAAGSVESATLDGKLWAYPMTADNGYFLYYDKSVLTEEDVQTLDGLLAAANNAGKKVFMDVSNGWYIASFFLARGSLGLDADGRQTCNFNDENGLLAAEAIKAFTADPAFMTGDDAVLTGGFGSTICAGVSGAWNSAALTEILGENLGASKLPTFTMDGEQVQMSSFGGYKLMGVNSLTAYPTDAMDLAEWLTNEENQIKRFETRAMGPSNINAAASDAVQSNPALAALAAQSTYAVSQKDVLGSFWSPAEAFGTAMEAKDHAASLQEQLDAMVAQIIA